MIVVPDESKLIPFHCFLGLSGIAACDTVTSLFRLGSVLLYFNCTFNPLLTRNIASLLLGKALHNACWLRRALHLLL